MTLRHLAFAAMLAAPIDPPDTDNRPVLDRPSRRRGIRAGHRRPPHPRARPARQLVSAVTGRRTVANTLVPYDRLMRELDRAASEAGLIRERPSGLRAAAGGGAERPAGVGPRHRDLARPPGVSTRVAGASISRGRTRSPGTTWSRILRDFRLAGVDRDSATRARVKALRDELVLIGQEFDRNIRDDVRTDRGRVGGRAGGAARRLHRAHTRPAPTAASASPPTTPT